MPIHSSLFHHIQSLL